MYIKHALKFNKLTFKKVSKYSIIYLNNFQFAVETVGRLEEETVLSLIFRLS